jgi:tetratricopeptide (TPR) repeat protein
MFRSLRSLVLSVATLGAAACVAPSAHASQEAAKRYFQNGVDLITAAQPNYQDAYYQFQLAYQESNSSWKVLGNLGLCALKLERDQEAVSYYEQYLEKGGADIVAEERQAIEQDMLLLKGNLATVRITSPVQDLKVIDRRAGSSAPAQSYALQGGTLELQLRAGNHSITAINGDKKLTWDVVLEPKAVSAHVFDFDEAAPSGAPMAAPAADNPSRGSGLRVPAYIAIGVGAVGLGVGGYFAWQASDYASQSDDAHAKWQQRAMSCSGVLEAIDLCENRLAGEVRRLEDESSSAQTRAIVAFSIGGAAAVTGVVLLVVSGSGSGASESATVVPWVGPGQLGVTGTF